MLLTSNVHEREIAGTPDEVGVLLDTLAGPDDKVWPKGWPRIRFDRELVVGAKGGHGPIRYSIAEYEPGRRIEFRFDPAMGAEGMHALDVLPGGRPGRTLLRHTVICRPTSLLMRLGWPLAVRWLHDACIEDLFDQVQRSLGQQVERPASPSLYVRALRLAL
jgi:hypothetical protein